jgi:hypothetical protein
MAIKYKMIRVPKDVWETWFKRKRKIQDRIKFATNKNKNIALTNVLRYYGNRKIDIWDDELIDFFGKSKRKKRFGSDLI